VVPDLVLAALSASPTRRPVLGFAKLFASMYGSDVAAMHVTEPHDANTVAEFAFGEQVGLRVVDGDPVPEIVRAASHDVSLVVVGAHNPPNGRGPGSVTREIARRVRQPLLVVPAHAIVPTTLTRVLFPLEGTEGTSAPIRALFERLPFGPETELVALHSYSASTVPRFADHEPHDTENRIRAFRDRYIPRGVIGRIVERYGPAEHVVPEIAEILDVTVTVVSWSQTLAPGRALLIKTLLADRKRPTLLVPDRYQPFESGPNEQTSRPTDTPWSIPSLNGLA
jgi:nucleotide-binding universal stress UspA family protein